MLEISVRESGSGYFLYISGIYVGLSINDCQLFQAINEVIENREKQIDSDYSGVIVDDAKFKRQLIVEYICNGNYEDKAQLKLSEL